MVPCNNNHVKTETREFANAAISIVLEETVNMGTHASTVKGDLGPVCTPCLFAI